MIKLIEMYIKVGQRDDFILMSGWEDLFIPSLSIGIDTFTMGGPGNLFPGLCKDILQKYQAGQRDEAVKLFLQMTQFQHDIYGLSCGALGAIKGVLSILGLCNAFMASPMETANTDELAFIRQKMVASGLFKSVLA